MLKQLLATTALGLALVLPAAAQEAQAPAPDALAPQAPGAAPEQPQQPLAPVDLASVTAEDLIGISVVNANEESLGTVDDALLSSDGKIENLVVSFGGVLGFGAKTVELSMDQVDIKSRGDAPYYAVTDLTPEALEALPAYEKK
jgi:sporulation protein YlmC with PRC-barrel domain